MEASARTEARAFAERDIELDTEVLGVNGRLVTLSSTDEANGYVDGVLATYRCTVNGGKGALLKLRVGTAAWGPMTCDGRTQDLPGHPLLLGGSGPAGSPRSARSVGAVEFVVAP